MDGAYDGLFSDEDVPEWVTLSEPIEGYNEAVDGENSRSHSNLYSTQNSPQNEENGNIPGRSNEETDFNGNVNGLGIDENNNEATDEVYRHGRENSGVNDELTEEQLSALQEAILSNRSEI